MKKFTIRLSILVLAISVSMGIAQAAPKELVVGNNNPFSGPAASSGLASQRALDRAAELINEKGFVVQGEKYILKFVHYDSKYIPAESVANLEKMMVQGIRFLYSGGSGASVPLVEKTTAAKMLQLTFGSGSDHLTSPKYPYSIRTIPCNESAFAMYPWLVKDFPQVKTVAHINPSDEAGFTESETRLKCAKNMGLKNVANEFYKRGATDYYPVATKVAAAKPDFIDFGGTIGRDQALCIKALRELGYKGPLGIGYSDPAAVVKIAGPEAAEGAILFNTITSPTNPKQKEIESWYLNKYGPPVLTIVYDTWDVPFMLVEAVKKANSVDPVKVAEAFRTVRWASIFGEMFVGMEALYGIKCTFCRPVPMGIIKNGKATHLATVPWPSDEMVNKLNAQ
jgi:branched-chain amino acid transport system substrate-binding protein